MLANMPWPQPRVGGAAAGRITGSSGALTFANAPRPQPPLAGPGAGVEGKAGEGVGAGVGVGAAEALGAGSSAALALADMPCIQSNAAEVAGALSFDGAV